MRLRIGEAVPFRAEVTSSDLHSTSAIFFLISSAILTIPICRVAS